MLFKLLDKLRKKPEHVRRMLAVCISGLITLVIFLFWIVSYVQYVSDKMNSDSPMSLTSSLGQFGSKVANSFSNMKNGISSSFSGQPAAAIAPGVDPSVDPGASNVPDTSLTPASANADNADGQAQPSQPPADAASDGTSADSGGTTPGSDSAIANFQYSGSAPASVSGN